MAPSGVNDAGRADEGLLARWHKDTNGSVASTGSADAYVVAANQTLSAYYDGLEIAFDANFANTGAATLNVDAVSADTIKKHGDTDLAANDIKVGQKVVVIHDGTNWQMVSPLGNEAASVDVANVFTATQQVKSTDAGANAAPIFQLDRESASPLANDILGAIDFIGRDSVAAAVTYGRLDFRITDPTNLTESAALEIRTFVAGTAGVRASVGDGLWMAGATGGDQAAGTINATAVYDDGNQIHALQDGLQTKVDATNGGANDLTTIDFTGIRSDARRITILFEDVSLSITDEIIVELGDAGGFEQTGYQGSVSNASVAVVFSTSFQVVAQGVAAAGYHGSMILTLMDASTFTWIAQGTVARDDTTSGAVNSIAGSKSLSDVLTQIRITRNGTDTFDGGNINILVE